MWIMNTDWLMFQVKTNKRGERSNMKLLKTASGKQTIKISYKEWTSIGKKAGWIKKAQQTASKENIKKMINDYLLSLGLSPFVRDSEEFDGDSIGGIWFGDKSEAFQAYTKPEETLSEMLKARGWLLEPYDSSTFMAFPN